jgi:hypothetical protein
MEQDVFDRIKLKEFKELNDSERLEIADFCENESEFNEYKGFFQNVERMNVAELASPEMQPSKNVKSKLDNLFATKFPAQQTTSSRSIWNTIYPSEKVIWMRPLVQFAAILLLFIGMLPLLLNKQLENSKTQLAKNEAQIKEETPDANKEIGTSTNEDLPMIDSKTTNENPATSLLAEDQFEFSDMESDQSMKEGRSQLSESPKSRFKDKVGKSDAFGSSQQSKARALDSDYSDGILNSKSLTLESNYSIAISEQSELLDLLTASF